MCSKPLDGMFKLSENKKESYLSCLAIRDGLPIWPSERPNLQGVHHEKTQ